MKDAGRWEVESEGTATKSRRRVLQEAAGEKKVGLDLDWSLRIAGCCLLYQHPLAPYGLRLQTHV